MNALDDQLTQLDEQLEAYEPATRWSMYVILFLSLLLMSWMFFTADMLDELTALEDENSALEVQIDQSSPEAYQSKIAHVKKSLLQKKGEITDLENEKQTVLLEMSQSQGLLFDNRQYARILDLLLARSVSLGLKIELMQSEDTDTVFYGKVKQYKILTIKGSGNFRSIAAFFAFLEEQKSLVEVGNITIRSDEKKPTFEATVKYMGVAL
jgi:hypothetical protein